MSSLICLFKPSLSIELLLSEFKKNQIDQNNVACFILDAPLSQLTNEISSSSNPNEEMSMADLGFVFATIFGVVGASIGFKMELGPIIWGIASSIGGFILGFLIDLIFTKKFKKKPETYILISIHCHKGQENIVKKIIAAHQALGLTVIES
ncbi:hypothetical protein M3N64_07370 [Sporolactobacillus sp. CPB3-1]|uniref:Uncharacterized protein n=1 Tax=Sporolactobacillus mangiferae TaxID=2940498 RepID=A0ABT0MA67_9BACL|nr:hypothetical protein [Sporolactobacillus mangiferae]MCL1631767.1 hypothetical protein [Sporolactobacillus mangiferae]